VNRCICWASAPELSFLPLDLVDADSDTPASRAGPGGRVLAKREEAQVAGDSAQSHNGKHNKHGKAMRAAARQAKASEQRGRGKLGRKRNKQGKLKESYYLQQITELQEELVKLQYWVKEEGLKVAIVFDGRDAAGKGGVIKRILERTNPRIIRVVALGIPTERERSQWYFQRWTAHLPAAGEVVLFDRSWYTRALTEHVMGFCTDDEYHEFLRSFPQFERMLQRSGVTLLKYWFSISDEEQERRFQARAADPKRRWKLSPMDIESRDRWVDYSRAKDEMFEYTDTKRSPWYVVNADAKKKARLNCISHILYMVPYENVLPPLLELPPRAEQGGYIRPPMDAQTFVPERF
jgi:polyphosphate kinase